MIRVLLFVVGCTLVTSCTVPSQTPGAGDVESGRTDLALGRTQSPGQIEAELAEYLDREFGAPQFSEPLRIEQLTYLGEFSVDGVPTRYWSFPCSATPGCWATVQPWEDAHTLGWSVTPPPGR
jgi:hypothetical protein